MLLRQFLFAIFIALVSGKYQECRRTHKKIGCFWESSEGVTLFNNRSTMPWGDNQMNFTKRFACDCNNAALSKGYKYFAIRFYGICVGFHNVYTTKKPLIHCPFTYGTPLLKACNLTDEEDCAGDDTFSDMIYLTGRDGGYGKWTNSSCSTTCGYGTIVRRRECNNPYPLAKGDNCSLLGPSEERVPCYKKPCAVDGGFGPWAEFGKCSVSCGSGTKYRRRKCDSPAPSNGGKDCIGRDNELIRCNLKLCPVNGGFGAWSNYTKCSATCGGGIQHRTRECNNPKPSHGGVDCRGSSYQSRLCAENLCPVDGAFGPWSTFGECSASCGGGTKYRRRKCDSPSPAHGGKRCIGKDNEIQTCNQNPCPVNGGFGRWSSFTKCSVTCGWGVQHRQRECNNPKPSHGGEKCKGESYQSRLCAGNPCPVDGVWGSWSEFEKCSASCGGGTYYRRRKCDTPAPAHGGTFCLGKDNEVKVCNLNPCPVDGKYGPWSTYTKCSATCGGGVQYRKRECNNPKPSHGGADCKGSSSQSRHCAENHCPVDGIYGPWSEFGNCSVSCGGGIKYRRRKCDSPSPAHGGKDCQGKDNDIQACNVNPCPVDGGFGSWSSFTKCTASCGGGTQFRKRECNNPKPTHGGKNCEGSSHQSRLCAEQICPVDGGWGPWSAFGKCNVSCGGGTKYRQRKCDSPAPAHGGKNCVGKDNEIQVCNERPCPVDGKYGPWSEFGECSASCGGGIKTRRRICNSPAPLHGGRCWGKDNELHICGVQPCPVDGAFGPWSEFGKCSASCGGGTKYRRRKCDSPSPANGGKNCVGKDSEIHTCNEKPCSVDGAFGPWSTFGKCSTTCGGGIKYRRRKCDSPAPANGGKKCMGKESEIHPCNEKPCPVDGKYGPWSSFTKCSATCGGGIQHRQRQCNNPKPFHGGKNCEGPSSQSRICAQNPCPVDGAFGPWSEFGDCSASCGGGLKYRRRKCDSPAPAHGGKECRGKDKEMQACGQKPCPVDGKFGEWSEFSECSSSCGGGTKRRSRKCDSPRPSNGGKRCIGGKVQVRICNTVSCKVDGKFREWSEFSECTTTCGGGQKFRHRECNNPKPSGGGKDCDGPTHHSRFCAENPCPRSGNNGTVSVPTTMSPTTVSPRKQKCEEENHKCKREARTSRERDDCSNQFDVCRALRCFE